MVSFFLHDLDQYRGEDSLYTFHMIGFWKIEVWYTQRWPLVGLKMYLVDKFD